MFAAGGLLAVILTDPRFFTTHICLAISRQIAIRESVAVPETLGAGVT